VRRTTHWSWLLYASLAVGLLGCALQSQQNGHWPGTLFFTGAAIGAGMAIVHTSWLLDEYRHALARLDHPAQRRQAEREQAIADALNAVSCCEIAWTSLGTAHDPATCTRTDQTT
jgi:hypothetical protein